ncbi:hypothetical protein Q0O35_13905, partial [Staphylococcus aureus]|nr:hypothetical protein [Staphylococcus aureus]
LFSGCSEGVVLETKSSNQSDSVSVGEKVGESVTKSISNSDEPVTIKDNTEKQDYYTFGEDNKPQNKQYDYQKKASPELSDREILNSH